MSEATPTPSSPTTAEASASGSDFRLPTSDSLLFEAFLRHGLSRDHLAKAINNPNLTTLEILAWLNQPHIAEARAAVRRFANESAAISLALSQVQAINTLARLTTSSPDPTQQRLAATTLLRAAQPGAAKRQSAPPQAEGLNGRNRGWSDRQRRSSDTPGPAPLTPYPEAVLGAPFASNTIAAHNSDSIDSFEPLPLQSHSASAPSASSAPSAFSSKPTDHQEIPDPQALETLIQTLDQALDLNLDEDEDLTPEDEAESERAYQFFMGLGVPLSHPDIINAIAEGRAQDLESIAARIRTESPRAP